MTSNGGIAAGTQNQTIIVPIAGNNGKKKTSPRQDGEKSVRKSGGKKTKKAGGKMNRAVLPARRFEDFYEVVLHARRAFLVLYAPPAFMLGNEPWLCWPQAALDCFAAVELLN